LAQGSGRKAQGKTKTEVKTTAKSSFRCRPPGAARAVKILRRRRIRFHDWDLYDAHHAVFEPTRLAPLDLLRAH